MSLERATLEELEAELIRRGVQLAAKRPLTPEQKEKCKELYERWEAEAHDLGLTVASVLDNLDYAPWI